MLVEESNTLAEEKDALAEERNALAEERNLMAKKRKDLAQGNVGSDQRIAMSKVMNELQRRVMPQSLQEEVQRSNERIALLEDTVKQAQHKERVLLEQIQKLESGPGCAKELQEQIEKLKSDLHWQMVRDPVSIALNDRSYDSFRHSQLLLLNIPCLPPNALG